MDKIFASILNESSQNDIDYFSTTNQSIPNRNIMDPLPNSKTESIHNTNENEMDEEVSQILSNLASNKNQLNSIHSNSTQQQSNNPWSSPSKDIQPPPSLSPTESHSDNESNASPVQVQQPLKPYVCQEEGCGKSYKNANGLKYHRVHGHNDASSDDDEENYVEFQLEKPYECTFDECYQRYKNLNGIKYHLANYHSLEKLKAAALAKEIVHQTHIKYGIFYKRGRLWSRVVEK